MAEVISNPKGPRLQFLAQLSGQLQSWYQQNHRDLPWRNTQDPYIIWISEIMLQQTTVVAVIPYFEKFLACFPTVEKLAKAPLADVLENWAGLGYYSRARNLHKAAQIIATMGFPKSAEKLLELPGFGPYTSRAVASLAFEEKVGVLDGNVIRVLTRVLGYKIPWWTPSARHQLQEISDQMAQIGRPIFCNNGLMELGATICTPQKPLCLMCPWSSKCESRKGHLWEQIPLKKPRKKMEIWIWKPQIIQSGQKVALIPNNYAPFLKGQMIFPGTIQKTTKKPKSFSLKHTITHHDIFVLIKSASPNIARSKLTALQKKDLKWIEQINIKKINPSILIQKILQHQKSSSLA